MRDGNLAREILRALHKIIDNQVEIKKGQQQILSALREQRPLTDDVFDFSDRPSLRSRLPTLNKERVYRVGFTLLIIFVLMEIGEWFGIDLTSLLPLLLL